MAGEIAIAGPRFVEACRSRQRTDDVETIASELLPLCGALEFLGRRAAKILRTRRLGVAGRPLWLWGVRHQVAREPRGRVLVIGTWNYPLLLPGVQVAQSLAAGNQTLLKPAPGAEAATHLMAACFHRAGVPTEALRVLESDPQAAVREIDSGVDLVVLTGSAATGRRVLEQTSQRIIPAIVELSGCDAVIVLPEADPERVSASVDFGLNFNGGATCIGPRRLFLERASLDRFVEPLVRRLRSRPAVVVHPSARQQVADRIEEALAGGAIDLVGRYAAEPLRQHGTLAPVLLGDVRSGMPILEADLFAPVMSVQLVDSIEVAVELVNGSKYRLAASIFGPVAEAARLASSLRVGNVTINDLIVPTADPRIPFGGRGESGFGVTRGVEGLLEMTTPKVISIRRGGPPPHLSERKQSDAETLLGVLSLWHGPTRGERWAGLRRLIASVKTTRSRS